MLNFRKLKQSFSPNILNEGKKLYEGNVVLSSKILHLDTQSVRISATVKGNFDNTYECELEVDRFDSEAIDSDCDCPYSYDCQHLAALIFYLEDNLNEIISKFSQEADLDSISNEDESAKQELEEAFKKAQDKASIKMEENVRKELLSEYIDAAQILATSPFFLPKERLEEDQAELAVIFTQQAQQIFDHQNAPEIQLALRLPFRSKPLHVANIKEFLEAYKYSEPLYMGNRRFFFNKNSFSTPNQVMLEDLINNARFSAQARERHYRTAQMNAESFGNMLHKVYDHCMEKVPAGTLALEEEPIIPSMYVENIETPLKCSPSPAQLRFSIDYIRTPFPKIFLKPSIDINGEDIDPENICFYYCSEPGLIYENTYYRFSSSLKRKHLQNLNSLRQITVPEPLFGTFVENALPELSRFGEVSNKELVESFVTLPYVKPLEARCDIAYLDGELDATLHFIYENVEIPASEDQLTNTQVTSFVTPQGVVARNLAEEKKLLNDLFQGFTYEKEQGVFTARVAKKIVEFMTETLPRWQEQVTFNCPENLQEQFIFDSTHLSFLFKESEAPGYYELELTVDGHLNKVQLDQLWDCISSRKTFIELEGGKGKRGRKAKTSSTPQSKLPKILILNLDTLTPLVQLLDELGINQVETQNKKLPLWSLATLHTVDFEKLPCSIEITDTLLNIQQQLLGQSAIEFTPVPKEVKASLRNYQVDGVKWVERLRSMYLSGILADDMGLGKTLQAISAITQHHQKFPNTTSLVVCPTSLTYNWKEEINKFNPQLTTLLIDGTPSQRKKLLNTSTEYDVIITSYTLLQKDIDIHKKNTYAYCILDEAQHIKNRTTRNAKSVKNLQALHRLILTGTPIENSLDELWSLFDFLMPGLLSSYERFVEKYVRNSAFTDSLKQLQKKVAPFILRRMKEDVLDDLPPVSNIVYHCQLTPVQEELYRSYATSAKEELMKLVKKEGFEKVRIHVLATLTRLKQICCHPAIFAKDKADVGDSAKYEMLLELLQTLIESKHKTVIFSQYTRMLKLMRDDFDKRGMNYAYLDGSSKNRLDIVKQFNEDPSIPIFLVSLKAGGYGLNLVGADTVIHYDMWWNPAVEDQATDRVHRIGQKSAVSSYKLITLSTIEEKILQLQERKKDIMSKVVKGDDEVISKLTWEEVLELLEV